MSPALPRTKTGEDGDPEPWFAALAAPPLIAQAVASAWR